MNEITYTMVGDYNLPNLTLPEQPEVIQGKWSQMRRTYLKETPQGSVLQSPDERDTEQSSVRSTAEGDQTGRNAYQADGTARGADGADESGRYDELGSLDEQHQELGTGNRESTGNIRLEYYDRSNEDKSLPFSAEMILSERYSVLHRIYRLLLKILKTSMREIPIAIPVPNISRVSSITIIPNSHCRTREP